MAIRVIERQARSGEGDRSGRKGFTRTFTVQDVRPSAIPLDLSDPPIVDPIDGTILPRPGEFYLNMPCDRVVPSELGDGRGSVVQVQYSSNGRFKVLDNADVEQPGLYAKALFNPFEAEISIPLQKYVKRTFTANGTDQTIEAWEVFDFTATQTFQIAEVRVGVQNISPAEWRLLAEQSNVIHQINGVKLRHLHPVVTPLGNSLEIMYRWEHDPGTPGSFLFNGTNGNISGKVLTPTSLPIDPEPPAGFIRSQYHKLDTFASEDPTDFAKPHNIIQIQQWPEDLNGWQSLPGNPGSKLQ